MDGSWKGNVTVSQLATNVSLLAQDGMGHSGPSGLFNVCLTNDLSLSLTAGPLMLRDLAAYVGCLGHMDTATRGIFDTRPVVFYLSGTVFFLFLTQRVLEARRLRA